MQMIAIIGTVQQKKFAMNFRKIYIKSLRKIVTIIFFSHTEMNRVESAGSFSMISMNLDLKTALNSLDLWGARFLMRICQLLKDEKIQSTEILRETFSYTEEVGMLNLIYCVIEELCLDCRVWEERSPF